MAFERLAQWFPNITHIDPRLSEKYSVGSKYAVVSITRYPTYRELRNAGRSIADSRMLGLIQSFSAPQTRPIQRLFELGSRYPYSVPGKFMGSISMSSIMFDAGANLLGGIYEEAFMEKGTDNEPPEGGIMSPSGKEILNRPKLYEDGLPKTYDLTDVGAIQGGDYITKDYGAIRMSLDDNRLDIPFGLVLTLFQSSKRIRASSSDEQGLNIVDVDNFTYRAMACLFFEMVKLEDYSFDLNANQELIPEFARFFYTGLINIKTSLQSSSQPVSNTNVIDNG